MFRYTVGASLVLFIALLSMSQSGKADPPEPSGPNPPLAIVS
jgi:hypothetical protein